VASIKRLKKAEWQSAVLVILVNDFKALCQLLLALLSCPSWVLLKPHVISLGTRLLLTWTYNIIKIYVSSHTQLCKSWKNNFKAQGASASLATTAA
jgi:hypothetical protein